MFAKKKNQKTSYIQLLLEAAWTDARSFSPLWYDYMATKSFYSVNLLHIMINLCIPENLQVLPFFSPDVFCPACKQRTTLTRFGDTSGSCVMLLPPGLCRSTGGNAEQAWEWMSSGNEQQWWGKEVTTAVGTILNPSELSPSFSSAALTVWERGHSYKTPQTQTITPSSPKVLLTKIFSNEVAIIFLVLIFYFHNSGSFW